MTELNADDFAGMSPAQFVKLLKDTPESELKSAMRGGKRAPILDAIFFKMPKLFRPERAGQTSAVIHWNLTGRADGGVDTYQIAIANGACAVSSIFDQEARLAVTLGGVEFLKLISGRANPALMFMTGKLRAKGDLGLATSVITLFDLPNA